MNLKEGEVVSESSRWWSAVWIQPYLRLDDRWSSWYFKKSRQQQAKCGSSLLSLVESVREHSPQNQNSNNDKIFSNDTEPEDFVDTLLDDLHAYVKCLTKLKLSLERPAPDCAISAPKKNCHRFLPLSPSELINERSKAGWTCHWLSVFSITGELIDERRKSQLYPPEQAKRRVKSCEGMLLHQPVLEESIAEKSVTD